MTSSDVLAATVWESVSILYMKFCSIELSRRSYEQTIFHYYFISTLLYTSVGDPWHFGADPDPDPRIRTLWLMDSALDPDPTPDPIPFFSDFKDAKKITFSYYFS